MAVKGNAVKYLKESDIRPTLLETDQSIKDIYGYATNSVN